MYFLMSITDFAHLLVDSVEIDAFTLAGQADLALLPILNLLRNTCKKCLSCEQRI